MADLTAKIPGQGAFKTIVHKDTTTKGPAERTGYQKEINERSAQGKGETGGRVGV
jgi:hypothetical protein